MKSGAFFGHSKGDYGNVEVELKHVIRSLIEKEGVFQFYSGARGAFEILCAKVVYELKQEFPQIKITKVLSYIPKPENKNTLNFFDDSVYLLEWNVPPKYAILETNFQLIRQVDFIVSGVKYSFGGAAKAIEYARKRDKIIIDLFT